MKSLEVFEAVVEWRRLVMGGRKERRGCLLRDCFVT